MSVLFNQFLLLQIKPGVHAILNFFIITKNSFYCIINAIEWSQKIVSQTQ